MYTYARSEHYYCEQETARKWQMQQICYKLKFIYVISFDLLEGSKNQKSFPGSHFTWLNRTDKTVILYIAHMLTQLKAAVAVCCSECSVGLKWK